jgi:O-antigen/teichoic acid export membrane protein
MSFLVFGLSLFSKELVELVLSENYYESYKVIPIIALSFLFFTFYTLFAVGLFAEKKSKKIASSTIS